MSSIDEILPGYESLRAGQEASYKDLHRHPELCHQQHRTAWRVGERLRGNGFTIAGGVGGAEVVGVRPTAAGGPTVCSAASSTPCNSRSTRRSGVMAAASASAQTPEILDRLIRGGLADSREPRTARHRRRRRPSTMPGSDLIFIVLPIVIPPVLAIGVALPFIADSHTSRSQAARAAVPQQVKARAPSRRLSRSRSHERTAPGPAGRTA
jgi:hypothetical protein